MTAVISHTTIVLADPEGNEFCILRSEAERAAARG